MWVIGDCVFDASSRRLMLGQVERRLSPKAASVLLALAETPRQVWSRDALLERVWPTVHVGEEVLTHAISELRRAFSDDKKTPRYVETLHKSGYRLIAPVRRADDDQSGAFPGGTQVSVMSVGAYAAYLEAQDLYERGERHCVETAVELLSHIVSANPTFAMAHVALAKALVTLDTYFQRGERRTEEALGHCTVAHRIASGSADAYAAEGLILSLQRKPELAGERFMKALALRPDDAETHHLLAVAACPLLEPHAAAVLFERTAMLRPSDYYSPLKAGTLRLMSDPGRAHANFATALQRVETRLQIDPTDTKALSAKSRCLWELQRADDAFSLVAELAQDDDRLTYQLAGTLARAGELDRAALALEQVVDRGFRHRSWLERDPDFSQMSDHPRFKRLAAALH